MNTSGKPFNSVLSFSPLVLLPVASVAFMIIAMSWTPDHAEPAPAPVPGANTAYAPYVFIDDGTGRHYLATHNSAGLVPRVAADGKSHAGCKGGAQ